MKDYLVLNLGVMMATDKIKKEDDPALEPQQAGAGSRITATDVARALVKWQRRAPGFLEKLAEAKGAP